MAAYDALPPAIREALGNAAFSWAPYPIYQRFRRGGLRADVYAKVNAQWDRNQIAKDRKRVWGISGQRTKRSK